MTVTLELYHVIMLVLTIIGAFWGLAKMLVGAKSWQDTNFPEYGRFSHYRRKDVANQIEIMLQQGYVTFNSHNCLIPVTPS